MDRPQLYKMVNGRRVRMSDSEQLSVYAEWKLREMDRAEYRKKHGYKDKRRREYCSTEEQLDMLYHDLKMQKYR